jgi:DNA polymerase III alpha subunit
MTITEYKVKQSLKDAASALKVPYGEANAAVKELDTDATWDDYLHNVKCKALHKKYPDVLTLAQAFEGKIKSFGVHAAAVVLSKEPISDYVPVQSAEKGKGEDKYRIPVAAYDMEETEKIGLQKIDLLGLKNLRIVKYTFDAIEERYGKKMSLLDIPLDDKATFEMLNSGRTKGVFQAEGPAFHGWIKDTGVRDFNDLVIGTSIARPGPMDTVGKIYKARLAGMEKVRYVHPVMEEALKETLGLVVYQEQLMKMVTDLAGLTMEQANGIRRTVAKKKDPALLEKYRQEFIEGASKKIKPAQAEKLWHDIEAHAGYSFNKSHAVAYSMLTNATAWLKCHYPVEYMYALLKAADDKMAMTDYLIEAKRLGVKVLLPHVNKSELNFSIEGQAIRFGLTNIKNIAEKTGGRLIESRPYNSYQDLMKLKVKGSGLTVRVFDSLNAIGAAQFPDNPLTGKERESLYEILNIPNFSTTVESDLFTPLDEYTDDGAHAIFAMVREIVQKDHWTRADLVDSSGDIGVFIDKETQLEAGQLYVMLIAKGKVIRYIPADDVDKVDDVFTDWLFGKDPGDLTEGFYRILAFRKVVSKEGKKSGKLVALDWEGNLIPISAFGRTYEAAALKCRPGAVKMLQLGEWKDFITLEKAE